MIMSVNEAKQGSSTSIARLFSFPGWCHPLHGFILQLEEVLREQTIWICRRCQRIAGQRDYGRICLHAVDASSKIRWESQTIQAWGLQCLLAVQSCTHVICASLSIRFDRYSIACEHEKLGLTRSASLHPGASSRNISRNGGMRLLKMAIVEKRGSGIPAPIKCPRLRLKVTN